MRRPCPSRGCRAMEEKIIVFKDHVMPQVINSRFLISETRVRSQASPCEFYGGPSHTGTGFSPNPSVCPHQQLSTNAPYSFFICVLVLLERRTYLAWGLLKKQCCYGNRGVLGRRVLSACRKIPLDLTTATSKSCIASFASHFAFDVL
jgi:hypothetical protein